MVKVPGYGPERARIMVVGEAPGADEERVGRPFVGAAGKLLRNYFMEAGIDPEEVYYDNICKYRPPNNKLAAFFADGGIPNELVVEGLNELHDTIQRVQPYVIFAVGNFPLWALTGKARWIDKTVKGERVRGFTGIQDYRGSILECSLVPGFKVIPSYHPAYILREGMSDHGIFKVDIARLKEDSEFPELRWPKKEIIVAYDSPVRLVNYHDVLRDEMPEWEHISMTRGEIKEELLSRPEVPTTLDIEYIGSKLLCVGLTNHKDIAYVVPTETLADIMYCQDIVGATKLFNAQNSMFDASILEWHYQMEIMPRVYFDTMLAANAANIELPKGLDFLVSVYTRQPYYKGMVDWKLIKKGKQPRQIVYAYNGIDVWSQHEVMEEQIKWELDNPGTLRTYKFMMAMLQPLWEMSRRGVRMDLEMLGSVKEELQSEAAAASFELMFLAGAREPVNVRSNPQVAKLLFEQLGLKPTKINKTGPACDDKTLAGLQLKATTEDQRKAITLIRRIRSAENLQSKFFDIEFDEDGRMRGHYDPTKTVTGRLASRKFYPTGKGTNAQNIPRDKRARRAFIADKKKVFFYADLERAESLVVAHLTGDPRMLADHGPGVDAHKSLASAIFGKPESEITDDERYLGKKTRHAGNYMQGWKTFMTGVNQEAHKTGISIEAKEAKFFIQRYKELHPMLPRWWKKIEQQAWTTRKIQNLLGRERTFYGRIGSILPEIVAFTPQSTVGDTLNMGFLNLEGVPCDYTVERGIFDADLAAELREYGYESLMQIHDAVGFQAYEKDIDAVVPLVRRAMSIPLTNPRTYEDFIIPVEIAVDINPEHVKEWKSNWGDVKPYTKDLEAA